MLEAFRRRPFKEASLLTALIWLWFVGREFYALGFASGHDVGRFSYKWALAIGAYALIAIMLLAALTVWLYRQERLTRVRERWMGWRARLGAWRWLPTAIVGALPAYFVFYTAGGELFTSASTRLLIFVLAVLIVAALLTEEGERVIGLRPLLVAGLGVGSLLTLAESFSLVSDYPLSQHWSEGNRIWDYSLLFGRERYNYPPGQEIFALIDRGRQALWGLPFLIPDVSIWGVRFWGAILVTVPYALVGWFAFREGRGERAGWWYVGLWSLIFLNQGPIYTPLVLSAILVAAVRKRPLWVALPLVLLAGHYAAISRYTWSFAPGIWAVLLTIGDAVSERGEMRGADWLKAAALGIAGIATRGLAIATGVAGDLLGDVFPFLGTPNQAPLETVEGLQATATRQPLLWYRLLPNEAYPPGILLGLALATLPLIGLLVYAWKQGAWRTSFWQRLITGGGLLAFLAVGLVASSKIGGGTDLHNLDMFLVSLVLLAGLAWDAGLGAKLGGWLRGPSTVRWLLAGMVFIPALMPMLTGLPPERLNEEDTRFELRRIQERVACAAPHGEVLLMDQRQLLTFGHLGNLPLVPEYEKKLVMNEALAGDAVYFEQLRADLEAGRFAMIVTERQALRYKVLEEDRLGDSLVEENNAWVQWVTEPLLLHYESVADRRAAAIEIFLPIERDFDC